jgi:hypothetical protein
LVKGGGSCCSFLLCIFRIFFLRFPFVFNISRFWIYNKILRINKSGIKNDKIINSNECISTS